MAEDLLGGIAVDIRGVARRRDGGVQATLVFSWDGGTPLLTHSGNFSDALVRADVASNLATKTGLDEGALNVALNGLEARLAQQAQEAPTSAQARPVTVRLADVERQEIEWLSEHRVPVGRITLIEGDPGVGKSWLAQAVGSGLSAGGPLLGQLGGCEPANVLLLTAEDGLGDVVRPRMEDMGADLRRITVLSAVRDEQGRERHPSLVEDLPALEEVLASGGYRLIIIDPINAYLGASLDTNRDAALRSVLTPLAQLAERWGVAILCIRHLTKGTRDRAIYRGQGNIAYTAAARVVHLVGVNPDDENERVMVCIKNNYAPLPPPLAFEINDGRFLWRGETNVTAAALLAPDKDDTETGARAEAEEFLLETLAEGPVDAEECRQQARKLGITESTLKRAKAALGVKSHRVGGIAERGRWVWELPKGAKPTNTGGVAPLEGPDTDRVPSDTQDGPLSDSGQGVALCPHRPASEAEKRRATVTAEQDPHACRCCGGALCPDLWEDGLCPVCCNGRTAQEGSGHLTRAALDMGARPVDAQDQGRRR